MARHWMVAIGVALALRTVGVAGGASRPFGDARVRARVPVPPSFGPNGIRLDPGRTRVYITVTEDLAGRAFVDTVPLADDPSAADLNVFHECTGGALPDGIAFDGKGAILRSTELPRDDVGMWTGLPSGAHQVCVGAAAGFNPPKPPSVPEPGPVPMQTASVRGGRLRASMAR